MSLTEHPVRDPSRAFAALDLRVRRSVEGLLQGDHAGVRLGAGSEPEEVVRYRPGEDDVRRIDWNVTARTGEPHVWRTRSEHELDTWVLVDGTPSMDFGTALVEKRDIAGWVTAAVGLLTDGPGNRLGVARMSADGIRWHTPLPSRLGARRALQHAAREGQHAAREGQRDGRPDGGTSPSLATALTGLERRQRRPGLRVVVSDFVEPDGRTGRPFPWEPALRRLASRHDLVVVEVLDPRELDLPDLGVIVLTDPETGRTREVWTSPELRRRYADVAAGHRAAVAEAVAASGAGHLLLRTDTDWVRDLARFVVARHRVRPRDPRTRR